MTTSTAKKIAAPTKAQAKVIAERTPDYATAMENLQQAYASVTKLDSIIAQQDETRRAGRIAVMRSIAIFRTFPECKSNQDIKRALGVSQGVLQQYVDGVKALGSRVYATDEITAADIKKGNAPWDKVSGAKKADRASSGGRNGAKTKAEKRESGELNPEDNAPDVHTTLKPKTKEWDLPSVNAALDGAIAALTGYTAQHGFTAKESEKLAEKLAEMSALVESHTTAKAPAKAKAQK